MESLTNVSKKNTYSCRLYTEKAFITCSLGYYRKTMGPPACSTHLHVPWPDVSFKGDPWSLEIFPPACAAKVLKKVVSWHQSLGDGGLDCYDQKGPILCTQRKLVFFHYYGCQKIEDFGLKLFQKHLEQVEKGCLSNKFGPFTLPMPRTSSSPCHIVGVVAHLPRAWSGGLWDLHASWVVSSAWIWMASLLMALGSLVMAKLKTWNPHISQVVVKLTDPEPATLWVAGANIPNLQRTRECWTRPGPGQRRSCLMTDLSWSLACASKVEIPCTEWNHKARASTLSSATWPSIVDSNLHGPQGTFPGQFLPR